MRRIATVSEWASEKDIEDLMKDGVRGFIYTYTQHYESEPCLIKLSKDQKTIRWFSHPDGHKTQQKELGHFNIFDIEGVLYGPQTGTFMSQRNQSYF